MDGLFPKNEKISINGQQCYLDYTLNCKDKHVIYIAQCTICSKDNSYIGQTLSAFHIRMNGHRSKFVPDDKSVFEESALSIHCYQEHQEQFDLSFFKLGIIKKVKPCDLDREESNAIHRYKTHIWGLNRIVVVR